MEKKIPFSIMYKQKMKKKHQIIIDSLSRGERLLRLMYKRMKKKIEKKNQ